MLKLGVECPSRHVKDAKTADMFAEEADVIHFLFSHISYILRDRPDQRTEDASYQGLGGRLDIYFLEYAPCYSLYLAPYNDSRMPHIKVWVGGY